VGFWHPLLCCWALEQPHNSVYTRELENPVSGSLEGGTRRAFWWHTQSPFLEEQHMSHAIRPAKEPAEELPQEIVELARALKALPAEHRHSLDPLFNQVMDCARRRRRILSLVQDALGQLRLDMKYLLFDLEATRRERDEYRRKAEGTKD
jgi:hypothetical protein